MYEELKELKELLDMGAITQEEFDAKKTELLSVAFSEKDLTNPAVPSSTSDSLTQQKSKMAAPLITSDTVTQNNKFATRFKKTLLAMLAVCLLCALCITSCAGILGSSNNSSSSSSSAAYEDDDDDDDYSSHSSSSSSTLLDEDDWVDTDDGKTYLKSDSKDGGTDYIDTDGEYAIHKNADGTGAIADGKGNKAVDSDGDGELDSYSTDNGKTWNSLE